jgi:DNA-directed RNA polymerase specialized sigma24 family protein
MHFKKQSENEIDFLLSSIEILPQDTVKVLRLYYHGKLSLKEICVVMNKSITTIRNHHKRGIFLLKRHAEKSKSAISESASNASGNRSAYT